MPPVRPVETQYPGCRNRINNRTAELRINYKSHGLILSWIRLIDRYIAALKPLVPNFIRKKGQNYIKHSWVEADVCLCDVFFCIILDFPVEGVDRHMGCHFRGLDEQGLLQLRQEGRRRRFHPPCLAKVGRGSIHSRRYTLEETKLITHHAPS